MKKIITTIFFLFILGGSLYAQDFAFPKGIYLSFAEIIKKEPSLSLELDISKRTKSDIKMNGGNDYKLASIDESSTKKSIKKEYWAFSKGDTLYINCFQYSIQQWYTPVLSNGKFIIIKAGLSSNPDTQKYQLNNKKQLGAVLGPLGGGLQGAKLALLRFIYVIDKETNDIRTVSPDYLKSLLYKNPELLSNYNQEEDQENPDILLKYLKLINKD